MLYIDCRCTVTLLIIHATVYIPHHHTRIDLWRSIRAHVTTCQAAGPGGHNTAAGRCYSNQQRRIQERMPTLTPSFPPSPAFSAFPSVPCATSNGTRSSATTATSPQLEAVTQQSDMSPVRIRAPKGPGPCFSSRVRSPCESHLFLKCGMICWTAGFLSFLS
jgi:hypothetical protein